MQANALEQLRDSWREQWPQALSLWSTYARLTEPRWCLTHKEAKQEHLTMSFAMIRLTDHAVVLNLQDIAERGLQAFPVEIMAHEIGHHIYCPGDLTDQGRLLARVRRGLPGVEESAPMIANLYADLFINDRLQRSHGLNLDRIYVRDFVAAGARHAGKAPADARAGGRCSARRTHDPCLCPGLDEGRGVVRCAVPDVSHQGRGQQAAQGGEPAARQ
jgi:hypothetical protein